jgi:glutamine synthetase
VRQITSELEKSCGLKAFCGVELEFYQFKQTTSVPKSALDVADFATDAQTFSLLELHANENYTNTLLSYAEGLGCPVNTFHTETGRSVMEAALAHTDACTMADNVVLFRWLVYSVAKNFSGRPTFMPKPLSDGPGCSGHIHSSVPLWEID